MKENKKAILCPNCRRLINRLEKICPHCGTSKPGSWLKNNPLTKLNSDPASCINFIVYVNVAMFVFSILLSLNKIGFSANPLHFLSPGNQSLLLLGSSGTVPLFQLHNWWSLVSANYLHGSFLHILFNMMALRQLGPLVIQEYGIYRMFTIYTMGGCIGYLISSFAGVNFTIGASAAICSLIGSLLFYAKSRGGTYGQNLFNQVRGWAISIFVFGFIVPGINNWGHGGGMLAGAFLGYILQYREKIQENIRHKIIGSICLIVTGLVLAWSLLRGVLILLLSPGL